MKIPNDRVYGYNIKIESSYYNGLYETALFKYYSSLEIFYPILLKVMTEKTK